MAHGYLGIAIYHLGRQQEALEEFARALRINPRLKLDGYWTDWLGQAYYAVGRWADAVQSFEEAIRVHPSPYYYSHLAAAHKVQGHYKEALQAGQRALKMKADDADFQFALANAYYDLERHEEALHHYRESTRLNPTSASPRVWAAMALNALGRFDEGVVAAAVVTAATCAIASGHVTPSFSRATSP